MTEEQELEQLKQNVRDAFEGYDRTLTGRHAADHCTQRLFDALCKTASQQDQFSYIEVHAWTQHQDTGRGKCYGASWEAGPYQWVHAVWPIVMDMTGRLCEPYHSFDLCFYADE